MKTVSIAFLSICTLFIFVPLSAQINTITGSWYTTDGNTEYTMVFIDEYLSFVSFDKTNKKFNYTWGGRYSLQNENIIVSFQYHSEQKETVGTDMSFTIKINVNELTTDINGKSQKWNRIDNGAAPLSGVWRINARKNGDHLNPMPLAARRTLKILSGTRFQWVAINVETKEFSGTGGGRYTFENGKYTEYIEFFSRDTNRVGSALSFEGKIENSEWHHSGLSSRGEPIYEVWKHIEK